MGMARVDRQEGGARPRLPCAFLFGGPAWPGSITSPSPAVGPDSGTSKISDALTKIAKADGSLDPGSMMEAIGAYSEKVIDIEELGKIECLALPGSGTCSAMFTACSMASAVEALGLAFPGTSGTPAEDVEARGRPSAVKVKEARNVVRAVMGQVRRWRAKYNVTYHKTLRAMDVGFLPTSIARSVLRWTFFRHDIH